MVYEIWYGDQFITECYSRAEALWYSEAGYRVRPAAGYEQ